MRHFFLLGYFFTSVLFSNCPAVKHNTYTTTAKKERIIKKRSLAPYECIPVTQDGKIEYSRELKITDLDINAITVLNTPDKVNSDKEEVTAVGILRKTEKTNLTP